MPIRAGQLLLLLFLFAVALPRAPLAADSDPNPKLLSIVINNQYGVSEVHAARSLNAATIIGTHLKSLGHSFAALNADSTCTTKKTTAVLLDIAQARTLLGCLDTIAAKAQLVLIYYVGPITVSGGINVLALPTAATALAAPYPASATTGDAAPSSPTPAATPATTPAATPAAVVPLSINDLAGSSGTANGPVRVVIIDALEPRSNAPADRAAQRFVRLNTGGSRRIVAFSAPAGEHAEPGDAALNRYTGRLLRQLSLQTTAHRRGAWLLDMRDLLTQPALVTSPAWPGRTSEVLIDGLEPEAITLRGTAATPTPGTMLAGFLIDPARANTAPARCTERYRQIIASSNCTALFDFDGRCRNHPLASVTSTALNLRCADQLLERRYKSLQTEFATAKNNATCSTMTAFVDRYAQDIELSAAPEFETAAAQAQKLCGQETRTKEVAQLETGLAGAMASSDCGTMQTYERENGLKLTPDQLQRLATTMKPRCTKEQHVTEALRICIERNERNGEFCSFAQCYDEFRLELSQARYMIPHEAGRRRHASICAAYNDMRSCFTSDTCENCSLPLRLAVKTGRLISFIERHERDAGKACSLNRELERKRQEEEQRRLAEQQRQRELIEEQQREAQRQRDNSLSWVFTSEASSIVHFQLYSRSRRHVWPAPNRVWILDDYEEHRYNISCNKGEKICYGAWRSGNSRSYWGCGNNCREGCTGCCYECGSGANARFRLNN